MNYGDLKDRVSEFLETSETTIIANIPQFIQSAESDIWLNIEAPQAVFKNTATAMTAGVDSFTLNSSTSPLNIRSIILTATAATTGIKTFLTQADESFLDAAYPDPDSTARGLPKYYAIAANGTNALNTDIDIRFAPIPDDGYFHTISYYGYPTSITAGIDSVETWLSIIKPEALMYGAIIQGFIFEKGEGQQMADYKAEYDRAITELKTLTEGRRFPDAYYTGERVVQAN